MEWYFRSFPQHRKINVKNFLFYPASQFLQACVDVVQLQKKNSPHHHCFLKKQSERTTESAKKHIYLYMLN